MPHRRIWAIGSLVLLFVTGCGWHQIHASGPTNFVVQQPVRASVILHVYAAEDGKNNDMNFDGYGNGAMTITIPLGWHVTVKFYNTDPSQAHSAMIVPQKDHNLSVISPALVAFPHAYTPNPNIGTVSGGAATFHFVASRAGSYALVCGVPGHAQMGMWDHFVVSKTTKRARLTMEN